MFKPRKTPDEPLEFIARCIRERKIFWTYQVNMRLHERPISRDMVLAVVDSLEIIEEYPEDKYLPSYLICAEHEEMVFHIHIATDVEGDNVRIVTFYLPDPKKWEDDLRTRRQRE